MAKLSLILHDFVPPGSPVRATLRRLLADGFAAIDGSTRMMPFAPAALAREVEKRAPRRVFAARNAQLVRADAGVPLRSVAAVAHPVLMILRQVELAALSDQEAAEEYVTQEAITAGMVRDLAAERPSYPFVNMQSGMFAASSEANPRARPHTEKEARAVAESLVDPVMIVLQDFPAALERGLRHALAALDIAPLRQPTARQPNEETGDPATLLAGWRARLGEEPFDRLCELNRGDLVLLDSVVALHGQRMGLTAAELAEIRDSLDRAAEITRHRVKRAPPPAPLAVSAGSRIYADGRAQGVLESDPVLGWRNRPDARLLLSVMGRQLRLETDGTGCRPVPGQPELAERSLAIYGCSIAFGWGVATEETFAALLQSRLSDWRVENHGVNAYGTVHSLLALRQDLRWSTPGYVTFCWSSEHRLRNVADIGFVLACTHGGADEPGPWPVASMTPRAQLDLEGALTFKPVALPRADLAKVDLADFRPDSYYVDLISFRLIEEAASLVRREGGQFFLTVVKGTLSPVMFEWLSQADIPVVDAQYTSGKQTNVSDGRHPDAAEHRSFADSIESFLRTVVYTGLTVHESAHQLT